MEAVFSAGTGQAEQAEQAERIVFNFRYFVSIFMDFIICQHMYGNTTFSLVASMYRPFQMLPW